MISAKTMLERVAYRYQYGGPVSRQRDASTLLAMAGQLEESSARVYLERFLEKWRLADAPTQSSAPLIRRRPMSDLERTIYMELAEGIPSEAPKVEIEVIEDTSSPRHA